jgi:hypothetical protein
LDLTINDFTHLQRVTLSPLLVHPYPKSLSSPPTASFSWTFGVRIESCKRKTQWKTRVTRMMRWVKSDENAVGDENDEMGEESDEDDNDSECEVK